MYIQDVYSTAIRVQQHKKAYSEYLSEYYREEYEVSEAALEEWDAMDIYEDPINLRGLYPY